MECPQERRESCAGAVEDYDKMCAAISTAEGHEEQALDMMMPDVVAEVTDGHEPSASHRELHKIAFEGAKLLAIMRERKAGFEQELIDTLPLLKAAACPSCPLVGLGKTLTERAQQ